MPLILVTPYRVKKIVEAIQQAGYALWDALNKPSDVTLEASNLTVQTAQVSQNGIQANVGLTSGKWYWEVTYSADSHIAYPLIGVGLKNSHLNNPIVGQALLYYASGSISGNGGWIGSPVTSYSPGDTIGVAFDVDVRRIRFYKNGAFIVEATSSIAAGETWYPTVADGSGNAGAKLTANFGATPFKYAVPAGYNSGVYQSQSGFAVWDRYSVGSGASVDTLNSLYSTSSDSYGSGVIANAGKTTGKWYWEVKHVSGNHFMIGICPAGAQKFPAPYSQQGTLVYYATASLSYIMYQGAFIRTSLPSLVEGEVFGIALDLDAKTVTFYRQGVSPETVGFTSNGSALYPLMCDGQNGSSVSALANFGQSPFKYAVPAGYNSGIYPTFALWDRSAVGSGASINAQNDLLATTSTINSSGVRANTGKSSGKWYWEVKYMDGSNPMIGIGRIGHSVSANPYLEPGCVYYYRTSSDSVIYVSGTIHERGFPTYVAGDVIGIALDADAKTVSFYRNGVLVKNVSYASQPGASEAMYPTVCDGGPPSASLLANFGASPFKYPVPAGYNSGLYS